MSLPGPLLGLLVFLFGAQIAPAATQGTTIGFVETFALAEDRGEVLDQLVTGTEEHFYYSSLHLQQMGELAAVDGLLRDWRKKGRSGAYRQIETRQALLKASTDAEATYRFLEKELGLKFDHHRVVSGVVPDLPTAFDQTRIDRARMVREILSNGRGDAIKKFSGPVLESLVRMNLNKEQRRELLNRLPRPDVPGIVEVILADLAAYPKSTFGSREIHSKLTLDQLEALRARRPALLSNSAYVGAVMRRLGPAPHESMDDAEDRAAYLSRAMQFAASLPDTSNSLKAHLTYQRLVLDLDLGRPERNRLLAYLRLPRLVSYLPLANRQRSVAANLGESFDGVTPFPAVHGDEALVVEYMGALFQGTDSYTEFLDVLPERFVQRVWAETKLMHSDPADFDALMRMLGGPDAAERLKDRVDLEFSRTNPKHFRSDDVVTLAVDMKNVDILIVKVFEIDAVAYFDTHAASVAASIDLDGLVANVERTMRFDDAPLRRVGRTFDLPSLSKPGTYVVELIGGGVSSRAVVRKGALHLLERVGAAGHVFRVLDGDHEPVDDAILRFQGRDFDPDERGEILVPFTTQPGRKAALLRAGGVASIARFDHLAETYKLEAQVHVPVEGLLAGEVATIVIRPRLTLNGERIALELLENASLLISATDQDGTTSTKTVDGLELEGTQQFAETIKVPERLASLSVQLMGTIRNLSSGEDLSLQSSFRSVVVNGAAKTAEVAQSFLTRIPGGYAIDVRGRNGEPLVDRRVEVTVRPTFISKGVSQSLKTDARGRVSLGALRGAGSVRISGPAGVSRSWGLEEAGTLGLPGEIRSLAGVDVRVPYAGVAGDMLREEVSLVEVRGALPIRDRFDAVSHVEGFLVLRDLAPGDYELTLKQLGDVHRVRVVEGKVRFGHVVGDRRALATRTPVPLTIRGIETSDEGLIVRLAGITDATRVHVFTSRYQDRYDAQRRLFLPRETTPGWTALSSPLSSYESGRAISDEYRYILERRLLTPYPGNMLARAGVLLNPWSLGETTDRMAGEGADGFNDMIGLGGGAGGRFGGRRAGRARGGRSATPPELDFLAEPATVLVGLVPDENGNVTIPFADLGTNHMIQVVAVDDDIAVARDLTRKEAPLVLRDRRLHDELDPARPMTQQRRIAFLRAGEALEIVDAPNANAQTFDTLADVFRLYRTMNASGEFAKFEFLTRWPSLTDAERLAKFSEFCCHELNVFLREKDPEFFAAIVAPYIANKGHRTFMDDWLLDADLTHYLEPWSFERLNIVEKILLLRRVEGQAAQVARDLQGLVPRGTFSLDRAFQVVLASGGLEEAGTSLTRELGERRYEAKLRARKRSISPDGGGGGAPAGPSSPAPSAPARGLGDSHTDDFFLGRTVDEQVAVARGFAEESINEDFEVLDEMEAVKKLAGISPSGGISLEYAADKDRRQSNKAFFRDLNPTQELAETHYWRIPLGQANQDLITVSPFWVDFAAGDGAFVSSSFPLATRSHSEMLLALAFLDLPFEAAEHKIEGEGRGVRMIAASPLFVALEDIAPAEPAEGGSSVLVGQDFFRLDRRTEVVDGIERETFVTGEFLVGVPYGCRMVITNPSSAAIELQALVQIPQGAIALSGTRVTRGHPLTLAAYGTHALETLFYFPSAGSFRDYPIHVGQGSELLGAADATTLAAVDKLSEEDTGTWEWISQNADVDGVIAYLARENPRSLDLTKVAWRMAERPSFDAITRALAQRNVFAPVLWKYAIKHRDAAAATLFLEQNANLVGRVEAPFRSPLFSIDPRERKAYEHLAYEPLVNGRTHEFGGERRILNDQFAAQYVRFLRRLALQPEMGQDDLMEAAYYLLLQDRIGEALAAFDRVERGLVATGIQYDYMSAYMDFYRGDIEHARLVATPYVDHPVARWRARFRNVVAHLDEIEGIRPVEGFDRDDRDESQGALAGSEPILELTVEAGQVTLAYEHLTEVEVRYHLMDVEFLFSTNPFVRGESGAFGFIQPNKSDLVLLPIDAKATSFQVPDEYCRSNLFVEVRGGGIARQATYFAGSLSVQGLERYGQVRVVESDSSQPLPRAYVKVYARLADGRVRFHKDGYTDLRGRFDYVSVSGWDGAAVERYAVLVMHEEAGATITELAPPIR